MGKIHLLRYALLGVFACSTRAMQAQDRTLTLPLWNGGPPGFTNRIQEPEQAKDWWVKHIHNPSLTVFFPDSGKANGTAMLICPGGGHVALVYQSEGVEAARYLTRLGITAIVLKYRLYREEGSGYSQENAWQDVFRAMRVVRNRSHELGIDSSRIGILGFSAGGELTGWLAFHYSEHHWAGSDEVDQVSARPAFAVFIYPGPAAVPDQVRETPPPAFLLAANDDTCCSQPVIRLLDLYRKAGVPVEVHLYAKGSHAFNMGNRSPLQTLKNWPQRLADWLTDNHWLDRKP
ncbi:MAG TPA: alpha/beta hydrolase [Chitinophagaceae bacterium]|nr:alpha/beta hydrolase [Chitinophagaceae bacterium]